jgi:hypothetical protein
MEDAHSLTPRSVISSNDSIMMEDVQEEAGTQSLPSTTPTRQTSHQVYVI